MELSGNPVDRRSGFGNSQSSRPRTLRAPLPDPHRTWEAVVKDLVLRLCLHPRVRRLACMDGLCEQWRRLWRGRTLRIQHVCRPGLDAGPFSDYEPFLDALLAILCAGTSGVGGVHDQEQKDSVRNRPAVELPDYLPVLQLFQDVTGKWMGLSIRLFYTGQLGPPLPGGLARTENADRRRQIKHHSSEFVGDRRFGAAPR